MGAARRCDRDKGRQISTYKSNISAVLYEFRSSFRDGYVQMLTCYLVVHNFLLIERQSGGASRYAAFNKTTKSRLRLHLNGAEPKFSYISLANIRNSWTMYGDCAHYLFGIFHTLRQSKFDIGNLCTLNKQDPVVIRNFDHFISAVYPAQEKMRSVRARNSGETLWKEGTKPWLLALPLGFQPHELGELQEINERAGSTVSVGQIDV